MQNLMDSFDAIKLDRPKHEMIAMRFLHGLDDSRYGSLKVWLGNEAANGRDLYPSNLDGAASQATRWLSTNIKPVSVFPPSLSVNTFITGKSGPPKGEKRPPKQEKLTGSLQSNHDICDFCSRKGHKMHKCFKFAAAKKAAVEATKAPRTKPKQAFPPIAGAMFTQ